MSPADHVFRHSSPRDRLAVIATLLGAAGIGVATWVGALAIPVAGFALVFLLLFGFAALRTYRRTRSPENWLLATDGSHVLVKLRSHLNAETAEDRSRIVELTPNDVVGLRVSKLTTKGHSAAGEPENATSTFLELLLRDDSTELADAVRAERDRRPSGAVWRHYPVTLPDPRRLRIEWKGKYARIAPPVDAAVSILSRIAHVLESVSEAIDLGTSGNKPNNADVARQLRMLMADGRTFDAIVLAARTYGISQSEARRVVDGLAASSATNVHLDDGSAV